MWRKKVNNNLNFEKSVIIVLNLSYYWLSSVTSVDNELNLNSFLTVYPNTAPAINRWCYRAYNSLYPNAIFSIIYISTVNISTVAKFQRQAIFI
jgi:hypothetical protein